MNDKTKILDRLHKMPRVVLDLGCGPLKKSKDWIGIDMLDFDGVDIVGDVYEIVSRFPDESVDEVHAYHFFEHVQDFPLLLKNLNRILKPNGIVEIVVPHFSNAYFYSDYTHKNFFGLYTLSYLVKDDLFVRRVPNYQLGLGYQLEKVKLNFKSPLYINRPVRKPWQLLFNSSTYMQEWYEDSWSRNFPCYEIQYLLKKL